MHHSRRCQEGSCVLGRLSRYAADCLLWRRRGGVCVWCLIGLLSPHPRNSGNQMPSSIWGQALGCVRFSPEAAVKAQEGQPGFAILPLLKSGPACVLNTSLLLLIELGQLQHSALCLLYVTSPSDHRLHLICQMLPFRQGSGPTERCFCHLLSTFDCSFGSVTRCAEPSSPLPSEPGRC